MSEFLEGIEGYKECEINTGNKPKEIIPGGYILRIINAKLERYSAESVAIKLMFDIAEGEYEGYYQKLYDYSKSGQYADTAKWKGTFNIFYPTASDPAKKKQQLKSFKQAITAINDSNPGRPLIDPTQKFSLDSFKSKIVGGAFGLKDWEWDGKTGTTCQCRWFVAFTHVRANDVIIPEHKHLNNQSGGQQSNITDTKDFEQVFSDGDIPF